MAALRGLALGCAGLLLLVVALSGPASSVRAADTTDPTTAPWSHLESGEPVVDLWFGWSSTCPHCTKARAWLDEYAPQTPWLAVHSLQIDGPDGAAAREALGGLADLVGEPVSGVPVFFFDERIAIGFDEAATTGAQLEQLLSAYHAGLTAAAPAEPSPAPSEPPAVAPVELPFIGSVDPQSLGLPLLTVILGGLDAVNPCALAVLLFLVSGLTAAQPRRRILLVGGLFVAAVGGVYFLLMAAWLNVFLLFGELRWVTLLAGAAAIVAGLINVKDFRWFRRGPSLVIPARAQPGIFGRLLTLPETAALPVLLGSTVLVAAVVATYEMLCTGGFPVVFTRVLTLSDLPLAGYYGYLGLYVLVYVAPLLAIVAAFAVTLGRRGVSIDEARRLKLLSGLLMLGLGGLLLAGPQYLGDLGATLGLFAAAGLLWAALLLAERWLGRSGGRRLGGSNAPPDR